MILRVGLLCGAILFLIGTAYMDQPPPAHTGGFGEPSCHQCHFDQAMNEPGKALAIRGLPARVEAGQTYELVVSLSQPGMQRGGFQLSARYAEGSQKKQQAGSLSASTSRATVQSERGVQYLNHTPEGTALLAPDSSRWRLSWKAPDTVQGPVVFHVAANAANGDASEFGDTIHALALTLQPE